MKKLAKLLVLFLVVALLGGILAVAAFAEETDSAEYVPSAGTTFVVWPNADGTGEPVAKTATALTTADISDNCYVKLYSNVSLSGGTYVSGATVRNIVIDLNGYKLTTGGGVNFGSWGEAYPHSITIKNGSFDLKHQFQIIGVNFYMDNLVVDLSNTIGYDSYGKITITDTIINATKSSVFYLGGHAVSCERYLKLYNTQINMSAATTTLFQMWNTNGTANKNFTIWADSECSFYAAGTNVSFMLLNGAADNASKQTVYLEDGIKISNNLIDTLPTLKYTTNDTANADNVPNKISLSYVKDVEADTLEVIDSVALYAFDANTSFIVDAAHTFGASEIETVAPDCENDGAKNTVVKCTGECEKTLLLSTEVIPATGHTVVDGECTVCHTVGYKPSEGVYYAVWESEADYLNLEAPELEGAVSDITAAELISWGSAYIRAYGNISIGPNENSSIFATGAKVTVELNGNKLTVPSKICIGNYSGTEAITFTVQNGSAEFKSSQVQVNTKSMLVLKNLELTTAGGFGYHSGGKVEVYDTNWTHNAKTTDTNLASLFWGGNNVATDSWKGGMSLYNTQVNITSALNLSRSGLFVLTGTSKSFEFTLDSKSSINYPFADLRWVNIAQDNVSADQYVYIEDGFKVNGQAIGITNGVVGNNVPAFATANAGSSAASVQVVSDLNSRTPVTATAYSFDGKSFFLVDANHTFGETYEDVIAPAACGIAGLKNVYADCSHCDKKLTVEENVVIPMLSHDVVDGECTLCHKTIYYAVWANEAASATEEPLVYGEAAAITNQEFLAFKSCYIKLYRDVTLGAKNTTLIMATNTSVTVELNDNVLTVISSFKVAEYGSNPGNSHFIAKNGKVVSSNEWQFNGTGSSLEMYNVTWTADVQLGYQSGGTFIMDNSTLIYNGTSFAIGTGYNDSSVYIKNNSKIVANKAKAFIKTFDNTTSVYIDKTSSLVSEGNVSLNTKNTAPTPVFYIELGAVLDTCVLSSDGWNVCEGTTVKVVKDMTSLAEVDGWNVKELGDGTFELVDTSLKGALQANLTLSSNFIINFHADPAKVTDVKYNGVSIATGEVWDGKTIYAMAFSAKEAADNLTFTVETVYGTYTLNYSVLKYAETLLASDKSEDAKLLAKAAVAYIKEAYAFAGATAPAALSSFSTEGVLAQTAEGTENYTSAIAGVQLFLDEGVRIVFNLNREFTGTVTIGGVSYNVEQGTILAEQTQSIVVSGIRAKDLYDGSVAIIADSGEEGAFTLAGYVANDTAAKTLLDALYTYCYYAGFYADNHPNLD